MKIKALIIVNFLLLFFCFKPAFALEHIQKEGLFSMDIPEAWHWVEYPEEIVIAYPDGKTMAIDVQVMPSSIVTQADIKNAIKESNEKMIKEGIEAHQGTLVDNKEITFSGVYASQMDFKTAPPDSVDVTNISFFNKGYAFTITYGSRDDKTRSMLDDAVATFKFR